MTTTRPDNVPNHATPTKNPDGSTSWQWDDGEDCHTVTVNLPQTDPVYHDPHGQTPIPPRKATARKLTFYTDPGHGWLRVNRDDLDALNISHKISRYSYERGPWVYLEEDCDATAYLEAAHAAGWRITSRAINEARDRSTIRSFAPYTRRITAAALIQAAQAFGKLHIVQISN